MLDTTQNDIGAGALGTGSGIGIAEYSNANFFSDDTIFPETFPYPGLSNLQITLPETDPVTQKTKTYLIFKPGLGAETNYRLAQASSLRNITSTNVPTDIGLDDNVLKDYAFKLFPRAISYSAGLIDYFFRGKITGDFEHELFAQPPTTIGYSDLAITDSTETEQVGTGTVTLVLMKIEEWGFGTNVPPVVFNEFPNIIVSQPVAINGNPIPSTISFSFATLPFPTAANLSDCQCHHSTKYRAFLVFRGTLGQESDAVVGGGNCAEGYTWHLSFTHSHWNPVQGHRFGTTGSCGFGP